MRKFTKLLLPSLLAIACVLSFAACDKGETQPPSTTPPATTPVVEQVTDKEFTGWGTYTGELTDGKPTGTGKLVTADYTYEGTFSGAFEITGEGKITYTSGEANGDVSKGSFVRGKLEGYGVKEFHTGCVGIGEWKNDLLNGKAYFCWPQGNGGWDWYYGDWENMVRKGTGMYQFNNGCWYTGEFNDWINGTGKFYWPGGDWYEGELVGGKAQGHGTKHFNGGNYWTGEFDNEVPKKGTYGYGQMDGKEGYIFVDATSGAWGWYTGDVEGVGHVTNGQPDAAAAD